MAAWDDVDLLDMEFDASEELYTYPCPCGDQFLMAVEDLLNAEELAPCPSCSLLLRVIYDPDEFLASVEILSGEDQEPKAESSEEASAEQSEKEREELMQEKEENHESGDDVDESDKVIEQLKRVEISASSS